MPQPLHFLPYRDDFIAWANRVPEYLRQILEHVADLILLILNGDPVNRIQSVVQEMRIDLRL
ncbi:hypothetical protein D3C73_1434370 [compost metagenome]